MEGQEGELKKQKVENDGRNFPSPKKLPHSYFPYGTSDFVSLRSANRFFVDNSSYISIFMNDSDHLALFRPPRFGKSLFLRMTQAWCDKSITKERREELFKWLSVLNDEEAQVHAGAWYVLLFDFSVNITGLDLKIINERFYDKINRSIKEALKQYPDLKEVEIKSSNALDTLESFASEVKLKDGKLLILVDEYDRFANELMVEDGNIYKSAIGAAKDGQRFTSPLRGFFQCVKSLGGTVKSRTTGLTPITMSDTSGWNVCKNVTLSDKCSDLFGFKKQDIQFALGKLNLSEEVIDFVLFLMERLYNGYLFFGSKEKLYNPQLSLMFLDIMQENSFRNTIVEAAKKYAEIKYNTGQCSKLVYELLTNESSLTDANLSPSETILRVLKRSPPSVISAVLNAFNGKQALRLVEKFKLEELLQFGKGGN